MCASATMITILLFFCEVILMGVTNAHTARHGLAKSAEDKGHAIQW